MGIWNFDKRKIVRKKNIYLIYGIRKERKRIRVSLSRKNEVNWM